MYCVNCGKEMPDTIEVCPGCGHVDTLHAGTDAAQAAPTGPVPPAQGYVPPVQQPNSTGPVPPPYQPGQQQAGAPAPGWGAPAPAYPGPQSPVPPDPAKRKRNMTIGIVAGAVALVAVIIGVVAFATTRSDPKRSVLSALGASLQAVGEEQAETGRQLGLDAFDMLMEGPAKLELDMGLTLPDDGYTSLGKMNLRMGILTDLSQKRMDIDFGVGMGGANLLSGAVSFDDDVIAMALPDLYDGSYGLHTTTLGADFNKSNLRGLLDADQIDADVSFNYFDMMGSEQMTAGDMAQAGKLSVEALDILNRMWEAATVEKTGKKTQAVNGYDKECEVYAVTIPQAAARTFLKEVAALVEENSEGTGELSDALQSLYGGSAYPGYGVENATYWLEELEMDLSGDVTCDVYVNNGKAVVLDARVPLEETYTIRTELGGQSHLSDAFLLEVANEREDLLRVSARGNHVMEGGVFSTAVEIQSFDSYEEQLVDVLEMKVDYDSGKALDNFESSFRFVHPSYYDETMRVYVNGTVDVYEDGVSYDFYDVKVEDDDQTVEASMLLSLHPATAADFKEQNPTMILDMKLMELTELQEEIEENGMALFARWMTLMY